jgi:response regulator RpfG family c-di-GMP phosphodiesterase
MSENDVNNTTELIKIKIGHLIKFAHNFQGIEVHVLVSGKFVKMNYGNEQFVDILKKLQEKKLEEVYINQVDCKRIMAEIQQVISSKSSTDQNKMQSSENSLEIMKAFVTQIGITKEAIDILNTINKNTLGVLQHSQNLMDWIKRFKTQCSDEFLKSILTSYLCCRIIDQFPWSSTSIKEKSCLASVLCDINLSKEDFAALKDYEENGTQISDKLKQHPLEIIKILSARKDIVSSETLVIIEQHHERPDGSGFPYGIQGARFNQLSTIFIVSQQFINQLVKCNFDYQQRKTILETVYEVYRGKNFDKAISALVSVVNT